MISRTVFFFSLITIVIRAAAQDSIVTNEQRTDYVWQKPVAITATATAVFLGTTTLFLDHATRVDIAVRDAVQQMRSKTWNRRALHFDDYLQFVPLSSVLALKVAGVESEHNHREIMTRMTTGGIGVVLIAHTAKTLISKGRPDSPHAKNSFPSGHTTIAFIGAEMLRLEYGKEMPIIPIAGYTTALLTGFMRLYNDRHWLGDVVAGAGVGIITADLAYWLNEKVIDPMMERWITKRKMKTHVQPMLEIKD